MREILFKAKRLDNGEWVQGWPYMDPMHDHAHITYHLCGHPVHIAVDPETVCQYTGLTDKNGVKIFEADKLVFGFGKERAEPYTVFWDEEDCRWSTKGESNRVIDMLDWYFSEHCTVTGNIHDNT